MRIQNHSLSDLITFYRLCGLGHGHRTESKTTDAIHRKRISCTQRFLKLQAPKVIYSDTANIDEAEWDRVRSGEHKEKRNKEPASATTWWETNYTRM